MTSLMTRTVAVYGESAHLHRLTVAFATVPKCHMLPQMAPYVLFTPAAYTLVSLHICAGIVTEQCDKYQNLVMAVKALASLHICTGSFEPRHSNELSCAGPNGDLCIVYVNSECCGESAPATTTHLCNRQCVVSMRQKYSQYVVIIFLTGVYLLDFFCSGIQFYVLLKVLIIALSPF